MKFLKNKKIWVFALIFAFAFSFFHNMSNANPSIKELNYNEFVKELNNGTIHTMYINNSFSNAKELSFFKIQDKDKLELERQYYKVLTPSFEYFWKNFESNPKYKNIIIQMRPIPQESIFITIFKSLIPIILIMFLFIGMQRFAMIGLAGNNQNEIIEPDKIKVSFDDVIGIDEIKNEVKEIVHFLKSPEKFEQAGAKMPKGIILSGAPGTGKTMLAKALAKEANVPFFYTSGSSFVEMFVGLGASRVRKLFKQAKKVAPCIIFIDEIDAIGGERGVKVGGHDEKEGTLNELLVQMDGMSDNSGVFIMAATNIVSKLDKALLRAGRFDRQLVVPLPNLDGRLELIKKLSNQYKMDEAFDYDEASRGVSGLSSAEITNLMNEAAIIQVRKDKPYIDKECFNEALDKIIMGMSNGHKLTDKDKRITAYHEAGHAVVGLFMPNADPVHKVTIVPRGQALGVTMSLPEEDRVHYSKQYLLAQISMLYGGFCAEKKFIGDNTTGASNDIERATQLAKNMITVWGLNDNLQQYVYLGQDQFGAENFNLLSESMKQRIENEIEQILSTSRTKTMEILEQYKEVVEKMVEVLLEKEVVTESDILNILKDSNIADEQIPSYLIKNNH